MLEPRRPRQQLKLHLWLYESCCRLLCQVSYNPITAVSSSAKHYKQ
eukprot:CCRYP_005369-RA/>CCRYP_005369-RA protein AED:0.20 eAED:1.00 QI:0/-1/0/1/-1/0/1/0/45